MADAETSLKARFELIDDMSSKLDSIASRGEDLCNSLDQAGDLSEKAFSSMESSASSASTSMADVAHSAETMESAIHKASSTASSLEEAAGRAGDASTNAASSMDYWTDAAGSYDKAALEAVYSTQELVDMGLKSSDALEDEAENLRVDQEAFDHLISSIEASNDIQQTLSDTLEQANSIMEQVNDTDEDAAIKKDELTEAIQRATDASDLLTEAQKEADEAQAAYNNVVDSGTYSMDDLEQAASKAEEAAENLAEANENAQKATEDLGAASKDTTSMLEDLKKQSDDTGDGMKKAGDEGEDAFSSLASAIASIGLEAKIKDIADSVYDLANSYSDASKIIVNATGATGDALDSLGNSALDAFAQNDDDLNSTAATVGELNTRLGLTGQQLTDTTQKFMDFADVTNSYGVTSVQNVTKIMNRYNMSADQMSSLMDDLVYAGQISGASVDNLSQSLIQGASAFQSVGMGAEQAINFLSQMELYGLSSTQAITALNKATVNFSNDGIDAAQGLEDVVNQIANMDDATEATALAADTFGSKVGVTMANAIRNGAISVDTLTGSMQGAEGALDSTAEAGESLTEKWQKASNSLKTALTKNVEPPISSASAKLAGLVDQFGNFLDDNPAVVKALTAVGAGMLTAGTAIAGVVTVTKVLIPTITALGTAVNAALGPIGLITIGLSAATAALTTYLITTEDAVDPEDELTAATQKQQAELDSLTAKYDEAVKTYGETSDQASQLRYQMEDLSNEIDQNGQTVGEMKDTYDDAIQSHQDLMDSMSKTSDATHTSELDTMALIQKLDDLSSSTDTTGGKQKEMEAIINELNSSVDGLNVSYVDLVHNQKATIDSIKQAAKVQAQLTKEQDNYDAYVKALEDQANLEDQLSQKKEEVEAAQEKVNQAQQAYNDAVAYADENAAYSGVFISPDTTGLENAKKELQTAQDEQAGLQSSLDETNATIASLEGSFEDMIETESEGSATQISDQEAVALAFEDVQQDVYDLAEAYQNAYDSISSALNGVFGTFDEFSSKDEDFTNSTVANAQKAMDSQLQYWTQYSSNIETIKSTSASDLGITQENYNALVALVQSGDEQSAGLAQSIVTNLQNGNTEAVQKLAETAGSVSSKKDEISSSIADWQTDFNSTMDQLVQKMDDTVDGLDLSEGASESARTTIAAYAASIRSGQGDAVTAAQNVVDAVAKVFANSTNITVSDSSSLIGKQVSKQTGSSTSTTVEGNASGTTSSADVYIAGEEGPELIVGKKGSEVFPTSETAKIIDAVDRFGGNLSGVSASIGEYTSASRTANAEALRGLSGYLMAPKTGELDLNKSGNDITPTNLEDLMAKATGTEIIESKPYDMDTLSSTMEKYLDTDSKAENTVIPFPEPTVAQNNAGTSGSDYGTAFGSLSSTLEKYFTADDNAGTVLQFPEEPTVVTPDGKTGYESTIDTQPYSNADTATLTVGGLDDLAPAKTQNTDNQQTKTEGSEKTIRLEINGSGAISVPAGADKDEILDVMQSNLRPVLMKLLSEEIYEEGNGTYDY